jgi:methyl-accepting chemotaxis protein
MSVRGKIFVGNAIVTSLAVLIGVAGIWNIRRIDAADSRLYREVTGPLRDLGQMGYYFARAQSVMRDFAMADDAADRARFDSSMQEAVREVAAARDRLDTTIAEPEQ